jgi:hypothetical protein
MGEKHNSPAVGKRCGEDSQASKVFMGATMNLIFEFLKASVNLVKESIWLCLVLYVSYRMLFDLPVEGMLEQYTRYGVVGLGVMVIVMWVVGLMAWARKS